MKKTVVRQSPLHGKGLFATTEILAGQIIEPIQGEIVLRNSGSKYAISLPHRRTLILTGKTKYVNAGFGNDPNVVFDLKRQSLIAVKDIHPGDELLARYESVF